MLLYNCGRRETRGLGETPISIFYSETSDIRHRRPIAEKIATSSSYIWDVTNIPNGTTYHVIVEAIDKIGEFGIGASAPFTIDHEQPLFTVQVAPPLSRGEDVTITVISSKELIEPPAVKVMQHDYVMVAVDMEGDKRQFTGVYTVVSDYDGTAEVTVKGVDEAGNVSSTIVLGGTFSVNVVPPPSAVIISPLDKDIVNTATIIVKGNVREDTTALLVVNGGKIYEARPDGYGNIQFNNVSLSSTINQGVNVLALTSRDKAGNVSQPAIATVKLNVPPEVEITSPDMEEKLLGTATLTVAGRDRNSDSLLFTYEISRDGIVWSVLEKDTAEHLLSFDTTQFPDGQYSLAVTADDGFEETRITERFVIYNFLPVLSFTGEEREAINTKSTTINGRASFLNTNRRGLTIVNVEFSLDQGKNWLPATALDGSFNSLDEEFIITLSGLKEGRSTVLVRAKDSRDLYGKSKRVVIVDFGPPPAPAILLPQERTIVSDSDDLDKNKAGVQITVEGKAEADNKIVITNGSAIFEGESDKNGSFAFEVTLRESGENVLVATSIDSALNRSREDAKTIIVYNNPPTVDILWPRIGGGLNHISELVFEIQDRELDPIVASSLSYRRVGEGGEHILARNMKENTFIWNVSDLREGAYELILFASDGMLEDTLIREFIIDNTKPRVRAESLPDTLFTEAVPLTVEGAASDDLSGIEYIEYSVDGESWYKALVTSGYKTRQANSRTTHPALLPDGKHSVSLRATDGAGNVSEATPLQTITIDTSPPRMGSYTLSSGLFTLLPEGTSFKIPSGVTLSFVLSLEKDTEEAELTLGGTVLKLKKQGGLWKADIPQLASGGYALLVSAQDAFGSKIEGRNIGAVKIVERGTVFAGETGEVGTEALQGVTMTVLIWSAEGKEWRKWQAESYGLKNPIVTDENGDYELLLPAGRYQILLQKSGFQRVKSSPIELEQPSFITTNFVLKQRVGIRGMFEDLLERLTP